MGAIESLSLALGTAWTSGINLYATVAALGIAGRAGMINLPQNLHVLMDPLVIGVACVMYVIEFVADKVPYVDSGWDVLHTFIRVPAGAILAAQTLGDLNPALELAAILAGGTVSLAAHGTKATTRLAINMSPEPFTNWAASITEDITVFAGIWLAFNHPWVMLALVAAFMAFVIWITPKLYRLARSGVQALRERWRGRAGKMPSAGAPPLETKS
ncbi:MAG TPA: DUF4126 domain-containing protein [Candidatus Acidoferrales bacterium]|nr:DUF4126 domain-containing protein [Candidatus Acidoferrales bacterium]